MTLIEVADLGYGGPGLINRRERLGFSERQGSGSPAPGGANNMPIPVQYGVLFQHSFSYIILCLHQKPPPLWFVSKAYHVLRRG